MKILVQPFLITQLKIEFFHVIRPALGSFAKRILFFIGLSLVLLSPNHALASLTLSTSLGQKFNPNPNFLPENKLAKIKDYAHKISLYSANVTAVLVPQGNATELAEASLNNKESALPNNIKKSSLQTSQQLSPIIVEPHAFANSSAQLGLQFLNPTLGNQSISPLGLSSIMAMLATASTGPSSVQVYDLFGPTESANTILQKQLSHYLQTSKKNVLPKGNEFFVQNKIIINQAIVEQLSSEYQQQVQDNFLATKVVFDAAVNNPEKNINQQIAKETQGKIQELLPKNSISASTQVLLSNTIEFKGLWEKAFDVQNTKMQNFFSQDGKSIGLVKTMTQELDLFQASINGLTAYDIPYQGGQFSLRIIPLPEGRKMVDLTQSLSKHDWSDWSLQMRAQHCILSLPKFKIAAESVSVAEKMQHLGVKEIFSTHADFTPMLGQAGKSHHLDNVFHAVAIEVDEMGTELVSATVATVKSKSLKQTCLINRPFLFAVIDKQFSTPLVLGVIHQP